MRKSKSFLLGIALVLLMGAFIMSDNADYTEGWKDGYCEGYKNLKGQYVTCPVAPVAPVPEVGQDTYKGGYNAGFLKGREKASE